MSLCDNCIRINPIPSCSDSWWVASVDAGYNGLELYYRLTDNATGNLQTGTTEAVAGGVVTIVFDPATELMEHQYHLELFESSDVTDPIPMTVGVIVACCIEFTTVHDTAGEVTFSNAECND